MIIILYIKCIINLVFYCWIFTKLFSNAVLLLLLYWIDIIPFESEVSKVLLQTKFDGVGWLLHFLFSSGIGLLTVVAFLECVLFEFDFSFLKEKD